MAPYNLQNRNVLVTGGSRGLGAVICERFAARGCNIAVNYVAAQDAAEAVAKTVKARHDGAKVVTIKADVGSRAECERLVKEAAEALGGLDIIINNAGWTKFSKFADLDALSDDEWDKCWSVNVKSQLNLCRAAAPIFNANPDGGALLITSSIAAISVGGSSMAYSVTKTAQVKIMQCLAKTQGPKIRVNAVLPGLLLTDWGLQYPAQIIEHCKDVAILKSETNLHDCAEAFVMFAENGSITGQSLTVAPDSGLDLARSY